MKISLKIGDKAPDIVAIDQDGKALKLADYKGKKVILFFYPKANTPGCTAEACNLSENYSLLIEKGFAIIGVSADDIKKQKSFSEKFNFPYPLIPDTDKKVVKDYGVWGVKSMYGREYEGIYRTTYIISENGKIEKIFEKVKTKDHTAQILSEY
ncbi:MAG: thioredoxin-dependent thiol peroxidase [Bacteroidales bacterium]|nr:thioredoxin-dependent thiol peroxidase [Bacteroidales bacterium]